MLGRLSIEDIKDSIVREQSPFKPGDIVRSVETLNVHMVEDCVWSHLCGWEVIATTQFKSNRRFLPEDLLKVENGKETT